MPRAKRAMDSVQNVLEIHFHAPRLAKSSIAHAEASDRSTGQYAKTKEKVLLHRFDYALALKLICFAFSGPRKLLGMSHEQLS